MRRIGNFPESLMSFLRDLTFIMGEAGWVESRGVYKKFLGSEGGVWKKFALIGGGVYEKKNDESAGGSTKTKLQDGG